MPTCRSFKRIFIDNNKYAEFNKIPYMDALAHVVEEYVYSDKLDGGWLNFNMKEEIRMFDFMTLAAFFISGSKQDFGKSTIQGYVEDLKIQYRGLRNNTHIEYPDNNLFVTSASYELILGLLWTTFIYASACYMWSKNEEFADTASMVYDVMLEESGLKKEVFQETNLCKKADPARKMMLNYMLRKEVRDGHKKKPANEKPAEDNSKLQARIQELEEELQQEKEKNKELKDAQSAEKEIESLKNDLLAFQTRRRNEKGSPLLTVKQMAIFLKVVFLDKNSLTNNVKTLTPLLQRFGGWSETTATNALGYEVTQDECNELAKIFKDYAPAIAKIIIAYPKKYKMLKEDKLLNNLKS